MSVNTEKFDAWIRGRFVSLNTELENLYFQQDNREEVDGVGDDLKPVLLEEGNTIIVARAIPMKDSTPDSTYLATWACSWRPAVAI